MKHLMITLFVLLTGMAARAQSTSNDPGWPRRFTDGTANLVVYHPQIDHWNDFKKLSGRCAFALALAPGRETVYGTFRFEADTLVDADRKLVLLRNIRSFDMRFPSSTGEGSRPLADQTARLLPSDAMVTSLDRILAYIDTARVPRREAKVLTEPPPILVSSEPALLVIIDGDPVMVGVENTSLKRVVNTNWELYYDGSSHAYYLRSDKSWLVANDLKKGTFRLVSQLPTDIARISPSLAGSLAAAVPRVIVVNKPAELIVTRGAPTLSQVTNSNLLCVTNTDSDLFFHPASGGYYYLASGRWFRAALLQGPWEYASTSLPSDFKRIPADHPKGHVLAAVPGTREADDAVLLAAIPRTAQVNRQQAKAEVQYVGPPQFVPIEGTSLTYAKNTPNDVIRADGLYYLCFQGIWFVSSTATGPWQAADKVPQVIYTIPESSPKYNVTYVRVYESTPDVIVVGYTPGYYGAYVAGGVVVWGTGYYYPPYVAVGVAAAPVYWGSPYYTYGASAWYNPATGVYARGSAVYGPYGGYGGASAYNPRTGTYAQGAAAVGPYGGVAAGRTYNPYTGTASAGYNASNAYGSWGQGVVTNGDEWARGGYQSSARGTVAAGQTSGGGAGVAFEGASGNSGYVGKSGSGDIYAGANGNVYKRHDGQWYQNQNGSWSAMDKSNLEAQRQQAAARDHGSRSAALSERWNANGAGGGSRGQGIQQRPQFQGRRR